MYTNTNSRNSSEYSNLAASNGKNRHPLRSTSRSMAENKENEDPYYPSKNKKVRHSPSLFSLKSLANMRRSSTLERMPVISQPTLDDSSREKVRNKIKHSPSMLSINNLNGESELHSTQQKRLINDLLCYCKSGRIERSFEVPEASPRTRTINLSHNHISDVLQSLRIHQILASSRNVTGFVAFDDVHLVSSSTDTESFEVFCTLSMPEIGICLEEFEFANRQEPLTILIKVAQALAQAENEFQFEHRNLHAGNIMVDRNPSNGDISSVVLINCDLARIADPASEAVYFTPLDRSEFYKPRLPILGLMRARVKDPQQFTPSTNVLWLVYLVKYLYSRVPCPALKRAVETLSPSWGGIRKAPKSAQEAFDRLVRKL